MCVCTFMYVHVCIGHGDIVLKLSYMDSTWKIADGYFYAPAIRRMRKGIKRCPCPSVRACVRACVRPSVRPSIISVGTL